MGFHNVETLAHGDVFESSSWALACFDHGGDNWQRAKSVVTNNNEFSIFFTINSHLFTFSEQVLLALINQWSNRFSTVSTLP